MNSAIVLSCYKKLIKTISYEEFKGGRSVLCVMHQQPEAGVRSLLSVYSDVVSATKIVDSR